MGRCCPGLTWGTGFSEKAACACPRNHRVCVCLKGCDQDGAFVMQPNLKARYLSQIEAEGGHPICKPVACDYTKGRDLTDRWSHCSSQLEEEGPRNEVG